MAGGMSEQKQPTEQIMQLASKHRSEAEQKLNTTFTSFEVISYASQVVAGFNYLIRVKIGDKIIVMKIYEPLPGQGETQLIEASEVVNDL